MDDLKELMIKSCEYREQIDELKDEIRKLEELDEDIKYRIKQKFIKIRLNGRYFSVPNTPENKKLISIKCDEKNLVFYMDTGSCYDYEDWIVEEYEDFIKTNSMNKLLEYIDKYATSDSEDD